MVGMTVGFTKTNRHPLVVLYEGRNAVGFLSIFCTNQPVGIGLVDSWTSPRGKKYTDMLSLQNLQDIAQCYKKDIIKIKTCFSIIKNKWRQSQYHHVLQLAY